MSSPATSAALVDFATARRHFPEWRALVDGAAPWLAPEHFALTRPLVHGRPLVVEAREAGRLVGALPLVSRGRVLTALASPYSPAFDYAGERRGLDAIWDALHADRRWSRLVLDDVPEESLLAVRLPQLAHADGCPTVVRQGPRHRWFALAGFEARLDSHFRTNLKRCARKAGGITLERFPSPGRAVLDAALALEGQAWKRAAGSAIDGDARVEHLYRALTRLPNRRARATVSFLRAGGERIAALISVEDERTLYALKIGYDRRRAALSPGHLLIWKVAEDAEARGLAELDLGGNDQEWKQRWTSLVHPLASVTVYRRDLLGLGEWALREVVQPRLRAWVPEPRFPLLHGCQKADLIAPHSLVERLRGGIAHGVGIRSGIKRALGRLADPGAEPPHLGQSSAFAPGSWVRVREAEEVRATLDARSRLRGLELVPQQWATCGGVFRVEREVRRLRDESGQMRPVSRTVLLEGVSCAGDGGPTTGCGRHCPLLYRDEWLAPAEAPHHPPPGASQARHARVRDVEEIRRGLDLAGRRDGLTFLPEMGALSGRRFPIARRLERVFELGQWRAPIAPIYLLEGLHCSGTGLGARGPCHLACSLLWHADWLHLEPANGSPP